MLNFKVLGFVLGIILGGVIFLATNWLLLKGGSVGVNGDIVVGPHLALLGQFFLGYTVSFQGSIIGFLYGFALGTCSGAAIGLIYNVVVTMRQRLEVDLTA